MSKKSSRPSRPQQAIDPNDMKLEGNVPTPEAPKRLTLALYFAHGHIVRVDVDAYIFQRNIRTNEIVGWEMRGMNMRLGFAPQDLVAWQEIGSVDMEPIQEQPVEPEREEVPAP